MFVELECLASILRFRRVVALLLHALQDRLTHLLYPLLEGDAFRPPIIALEQVFPQMLAGHLRDLSEVLSVKDSRHLLNIDGASIFQFADEHASIGQESAWNQWMQTIAMEKRGYWLHCPLLP